MDDETVTGKNVGLLKRASFLKMGRVVDLEGNLYHDLCFQKRFIPHGVEIGFKFYPQTDDFVIMTNSEDAYVYNILSANLRVCRVQVNDAVISAHAQLFRKESALFPFISSDLKTFSISQQLTRFSTDDICNGVIPARVLVAIIEQDSYSPGKPKKNPFSFQPYNVSEVKFAVEGRDVQSEPLTPNYSLDKQLYVSSYLRLYGNTPHFYNPETFIKRPEFGQGYAVYSFQTTGPGTDREDNLIRRGHTRLSISFRQPLNKAVTVIVYSSLRSVLQIDENRSITIRE